ncbi:MAG: hypothetical protein QGG89_16600, partial [Vicinamibacterales bacterium]|nr:hypothetical protein [Vicinamibacterales bacterium]
SLDLALPAHRHDRDQLWRGLKNRMATALFNGVLVRDKQVVAVRPKKELEPFFKVSYECQEKVLLATPTGDEVTITAVVANTGSESGAFDIALRINNSIEDAGRVVVPGGGTAEVSFVVSKPVGSYSVRVDRQLAEFEVVAPANPSVGDATPTGMLLVMLSALGALLAVSGALVLARSRRA